MEHDGQCECGQVVEYLKKRGWRDVNILKRIWGQSVKESVSCFCMERAQNSGWKSEESLEGLYAASETKCRFWAEQRRIGASEAVQLIAQKMGLKSGESGARVYEVDFRHRRLLRRYDS